MAQKELRNYEISIWSLQDDFITVLKHADIRNVNQLRDAKMGLNVDGTQTLSFSIPMYITEDGVKKENPIWYNYINGTIISSMRKIKVILNKMTDEEEIYEFIIVKVIESHQGAEMLCEVECEGLAFHELGKIGYKISLSEEAFYAEDLEAFEKGQSAPRATLQYWLNKFLEPYPSSSSYINPRTWYYQVQMDWSSYTRNNGNSFIARETDKIYEDEYVSSWKESSSDTAILSPSGVEGYKEKERMVNLEESNIYNLTQDLAETFGVYCKYVYEHNSEYRITGRKVIFYNSFIEEDKGALDITYKYNTTSITREMDGMDIVTKMYVRPVNNDAVASGITTIMDVGANKSREDYLLNFDYMYSIGAISQETYNEIAKYEKKMHDLNMELIPSQELLANLQAKLPESLAKLNFYIDATQLDQERINESQDLYLNIVQKSSGSDKTHTVLEVTYQNPKMAVLVENPSPKYAGKPYYITITEKGVIRDSIHIYKTANLIKDGPKRLTNIITGWSVEYDEFDNISSIINIGKESGDSATVYLTYQYDPQLYYKKIKKTWEERLGLDEASRTLALYEVERLVGSSNLSKYTSLGTGRTITGKIPQLETKIENILNTKKEVVKEFERMMGPALREGYWQPDDFSDYGDIHLSTLKFPFSNGPRAQIVKGTSGMDSFFWDNEPFEDEQDISYKVGVGITKYTYPMINLSDVMNDIKEHLDDLAFLFYPYTVGQDEKSPEKRRAFSVGSQAQLGFVKIKTSSIVIPVLILTGAEKLSEGEEPFLKNGEPVLGTLTYPNGQMKESVYVKYDRLKNYWINGSEVEVVYPRLKINSLSMKTSEDQFALKYKGASLTNLEDYYILTRLTAENESGDFSPAYYITLKPEVLFKDWITSANDKLEVKFSISNADTSIYLDAIQVLKDSSYPQVSYSLDVALVQEGYVKQISKMLNRIVHINDYELKFQNVQGYVSEVNLDLDKPWQDSIAIKNYKTKFEDLFTKIVASTEQMKKNEYISQVVSQAFSGAGQLRSEVLQIGLNSADLNYAFNNGKLTIDEANGIWGVSDSGVVAFRGGGIFTATEKDENDNWIWNTGIIPQGINAKMITSGQLDTNKINIYAGDNLKFVLSSEGLFAYKSVFDDEEFLALFKEQYKDTPDASEVTNINEYFNDKKIDTNQYVVHNSNGLFLRALAGTYVIEEKNEYVVNNPKLNLEEKDKNKKSIISLKENVDRVEISWDGLKLRNWKGDPVFWANPNTGSLFISGALLANEIKVYNNRNEIHTVAPKDLNTYVTSTLILSETFETILEKAGEIVQNMFNITNQSVALNDEYEQKLQRFKNKVTSPITTHIDFVTYSKNNEGKVTEVSSASAISIDGKDGIYLGSNSKIAFYSGIDNLKNSGTKQASMTLEPGHFNLNTYNNAPNSNNNSISVIDMRPDKLIFGVTDANNNIISAEQINESSYKHSAGAVSISKNKISLAVAKEDNSKVTKTLIELSENGILMGSAENEVNFSSEDKLNGSYVEIGPDKFNIGSGANIKVNTDNLVIDVVAGSSNMPLFRLGRDPKGKVSGGAEERSPQGLSFLGGNLYITGTVYADSFQVVEKYVGTQESVSLGEYIASHGDKAVLGTLLNQSFQLMASLFSDSYTTIDQIENNKQFLKDLDTTIKNTKITHLDFATKSTNGISAISIDANKGIYVGSSKEVRIFANPISKNEQGELTNTGASVDITPTQISFGVTNPDDTSTVLIKPNLIRFGIAKNITKSRNSTYSGVEITEDKIYFASGNSSNGVSVFSLTSSAVTIGTANDDGTGAFIEMKKNSFRIGANTRFLVTAYNNNFIIDTSGDTTEKYFRIGNSKKYIELTKSGVFNAVGINAEVLNVGPWEISDTGIYMIGKSGITTSMDKFSNNNIYFGERGLNFFNCFYVRLDENSQKLKEFAIRSNRYINPADYPAGDVGPNGDFENAFEVPSGDENQYSTALLQVLEANGEYQMTINGRYLDGFNLDKRSYMTNGNIPVAEIRNGLIIPVGGHTISNGDLFIVLDSESSIIEGNITEASIDDSYLAPIFSENKDSNSNYKNKRFITIRRNYWNIMNSFDDGLNTPIFIGTDNDKKNYGYILKATLKDGRSNLNWKNTYRLIISVQFYAGIEGEEIQIVVSNSNGENPPFFINQSFRTIYGDNIFYINVSEYDVSITSTTIYVVITSPEASSSLYINNVTIQATPKQNSEGESIGYLYYQYNGIYYPVKYK